MKKSVCITIPKLLHAQANTNVLKHPRECLLYSEPSARRSQNEIYRDIQLWSLSSVRCGYVPMHHSLMEEKNHKARLLLESVNPMGSQRSGEITRTSNARRTSQGSWERQVEAECVILTLCVRLVRPAYSPTETLTNQHSASWFVFSLYFLEAENRVCSQTAFIFSSCKFYFSAQL